MKIRHARTTPALCPNCAATLDGWGTAHGWTPSPGDGTLCAYCGTLLIFGTDMRPRLPTDAELADYMADPDVRRQILDLKLAAASRAFPIGKPEASSDGN